MTIAPALRTELEGWNLVWIHLEAAEVETARLADLRRRIAAEVRTSTTAEGLASDPVIAAVRKLFRAAGCDPTRYRPSSEALLRRILKGEELPVIHPLVDLNNCLSVRLRVPACIMAEGSTTPPFTLRAGRAGEMMESLRGPFPLDGKPLFEDAQGPFGTPITDSARVKVLPETTRAWMVLYLPAGVSLPHEAEALLTSWAAEVGVRAELGVASLKGNAQLPSARP